MWQFLIWQKLSKKVYKWPALAYFFLFASHKAHAILTVGQLQPAVAQYQINDQGDVNYFSLNPYFSLNTRLLIVGRWFFCPEVGVAWSKKTSDQHTKQIGLGKLSFAYLGLNSLLWRLGVGTSALRITGDAKHTTLPNGNQTADFFNPSSSPLSYTSFASIGMEYYLNNRWSVRADSLTWLPFSNQKRSFGYLITLNMYR